MYPSCVCIYICVWEGGGYGVGWVGVVMCVEARERCTGVRVS